MSHDHDPLRRTVIAALASAPLLSLADTQSASETPRSGSRILVAYFSRSGNTRVVAGLIQRGLGIAAASSSSTRRKPRCWKVL
jgi:hypothetical protein